MDQRCAKNDIIDASKKKKRDQQHEPNAATAATGAATSAATSTTTVLLRLLPLGPLADNQTAAGAAGAAAFSNTRQICLGTCVPLQNSGALPGEIPEGLPPTVNQFAHHHMWNPGKPDEETEIEAAARKLLQVEAAA